MITKKLSHIIKQGENEKIEFKRSFSKSFIGTLMAFSNDGTIKGVSITDESVQNEIFDDRIEFYNPGKLFGDITVVDLLSNNYTSKSRNKLIAKAFKEVGLIERYGSGIQRIMNICKDYGVVAPKFNEIQKGLRKM